MPCGKASCRLTGDGQHWPEGETAAKSLPCSLGHCVLPWPSLALRPLELLVLCAPTRGGVFPYPRGSHALRRPLCGAVMPEDHFACGEKHQQQKNSEFAFLNGNQCGKQSCRSAPHRCCVKRQHPVCWLRARPSHLAASVCLGTATTGDPAPGTGRGCWPHCPAMVVAWVGDDEATGMVLAWVLSSWMGFGVWLLQWRVQTRSIPTYRFPLLCTTNHW